MPEQISKYPDVTLKVLKESGATCGEGASQNILKQCPRERFCSLRSGEICVYGIDEIPKMTQVTTQELAKVVCPQARKAAAFSADSAALEAALIIAVFLSGVGLGKFFCRREEESDEYLAKHRATEIGNRWLEGVRLKSRLMIKAKG